MTSSKKKQHVETLKYATLWPHGRKAFGTIDKLSKITALLKELNMKMLPKTVISFAYQVVVGVSQTANSKSQSQNSVLRLLCSISPFISLSLSLSYQIS